MTFSLSPSRLNAATMRPGTTLPNGAVVVASSARYTDEWVLLCYRPGYETQHPYVTWRCNRPGDGSDTRHDRYFDHIAEAAKDFETR